MAGSGFGQPYFSLREVVRSGVLGEIVQIISEKSYPYGDWRPQDEALDGGLILQNAIHALRFIEHTAGTPVASVRAAETTLGNPVAGGGLRMASVLLLTLKNGGLASVTANYLNQPGTGVWGNETLKILGSRGFVESTAGGKHTRLVVGEKDHGPLDTTKPGINWLDTFFAEIAGLEKFPVTLDEELSPTRWVIRAKASV
jgi:predicted dehydrogenase